jgi:hypothetical protein
VVKGEPADGVLLKVLRRLSPGGAHLRRHVDGEWRLVRASATHAVDADTAEALRHRGLIDMDGEGRWRLSPTGAAWLRRALAGGEDAFAAQHQERVTSVIGDDGETSTVVVNQDEGPLAWLRRRRDAGGKPMVDAAAFAAGERLRADFSRAQMMPRITANWTAAVGGRGRTGGNGSAEITEVALAARQRVERALEAIGPELGGLLLDFCCFLKGLEAIEAERRWPARSAKVPLTIALSMLARHYGLAGEARGDERARTLLHWGTEDYRPTLD